jgi:hypothetical protein
MIEVFDFIYSQYGHEFRMTNKDLSFWKYLESTNRLEKYLKWRTASMLALGVCNDDLPTPPDYSQWPAYYEIPQSGLTMADDHFWSKRFRSRRTRGFKMGFLFSLFQGKAGSLEVPSYLVRIEVVSTLKRLARNKDVETDLVYGDRTLTEDDVIAELRRTTREVLGKPRSSTRDTTTRSFPSQNACFELGRKEGGAAGYIFQRYFDDKFFAYDYLMGFVEGPNGVREVRSPFSHSDVEDFLSFSKTQAMLQETVSCIPIGLPEPFKVRTITKGSAFPYYLSSMFRKSIWRRMQSHPTFSLTGRQVSQEFMQDFADQCGQFGDDDFLISTDFQAATDHIPSYYSESIAEEICSIFGVPHEYRMNMISCLTRHRLYDGETEHGDQESGQLMGSFWSFIVLCILHACGLRHALEIYRGETLPLEDLAFRLNGDDGLWKGTKDEFRFWNQYMAWFGLIPSPGKTLVHQRLCTINSEMWRFYPEDVRTSAVKLTVGYTPRRVPHVQMGWAYARVPRDVTDRKRGSGDLHPSALLSGFLDTCPRPQVGWKFLWKQHGRTMLQTAKERRLALCLPPLLGGVGFPLPPSGEIRKRRLPSIRHRLFARLCLEQPQLPKVARLTDHLRGMNTENDFAKRLVSYLNGLYREVGGTKVRELVLLGRQALPTWAEEEDLVLPGLFYSPWFEAPKESRIKTGYTDFIDSYIRKYRPKALSLSQVVRGTVHSNDYFARVVTSLAGFC